MRRRLFEQVMLYDYRYILGYGTLLAVAAFTLFWRLGRILPGLGSYESSYLVTAQSLSGILEQPLFWPHKLLTLGLSDWLGPSEIAFRLPSAILAALGLMAFFGFIRGRFRERIAIIAVGLLATSSWWLSYARLARPEIMLPVMVLLILYAARKAYEAQQSRLWLLLAAVAVGVSLFVPFLPYVVVVGGWAVRPLLAKYRDGAGHGWFAVGVSIVGLFALAALIASARDFGFARELLGLPIAWPGVLGWMQNIANGIAQLFWQAATEFWPLRLGTVPLLDLFTAVMLVLGLYHMDREISRMMAYFTLLGLGLLLVITQLAATPWHNAVLIPFVYLLVAAGVVMLFSQWYEIFPKNPVARMIAFIPTLVLLAVVVLYHQQRFFVAWPGSPEILEVYPPLSRQLRDTLQAYPASEPVIIAVTESEVPIAQAVSLQTPGAEITTVASAVLNQTNVVISANAFNRLDPADQKQLRQRLTPIATAYQSAPVALYYSTP